MADSLYWRGCLRSEPSSASCRALVGNPRTYLTQESTRENLFMISALLKCTQPGIWLLRFFVFFFVFFIIFTSPRNVFWKPPVQSQISASHTISALPLSFVSKVIRGEWVGTQWTVEMNRRAYVHRRLTLKPSHTNL